MLEPRYQAPPAKRRTDVLRFGWRYALPVALTGIGLGRAWQAWRSGVEVGHAVLLGAAHTLLATAVLLGARPLGLQTPAEVATTPAVAARIRRRRPWLLAGLAAAIGYVVWLLWFSSSAV